VHESGEGAEVLEATPWLVRGIGHANTLIRMGRPGA
jgi:hypothetical protein